MTEAKVSANHNDIDHELAAEANHRISNHLTLLLSILRMQESALSAGPEVLTSLDVRRILQNIYGKVASIAHLHRMLAYQDHIDIINLGDYLSDNCSVLITSLGLNAGVVIERQLDTNCDMTPERARSVALIVNEVIMNAIKHSHHSGEAVQLKLACRLVSDQRYIVEIQDDGDGFPEGFDPMADGGMGFTLIRSLADSLGSGFKIDSGAHGSTFRLTVDAH